MNLCREFNDVLHDKVCNKRLSPRSMYIFFILFKFNGKRSPESLRIIPELIPTISYS